MTHLYVCHDSFRALPTVTWAHFRLFCHNTFLCVPWLIHTCAMTHSGPYRQWLEHPRLCCYSCGVPPLGRLPWKLDWRGINRIHFDTYVQLNTTPYTLILQCVAVCCSVLQCVAVCCSVLQCTLYFDTTAAVCPQWADYPDRSIGEVKVEFVLIYLQN